jgi:hypothetical protein
MPAADVHAGRPPPSRSDEVARFGAVGLDEHFERLAHFDSAFSSPRLLIAAGRSDGSSTRPTASHVRRGTNAAGRHGTRGSPHVVHELVDVDEAQGRRRRARRCSGRRCG